MKKPLTRRQFLVNTSTLACAGFFSGCSHSSSSAPTQSLLGFNPVSTSTQDKVIVPNGYKAKVLISWGDALFENAPAFDASGKASAIDQALQFGDNNDGMSFFPISSKEGILAVNHETANPHTLFGHQGFAMNADDIKKTQAAVGVSIFTIRLGSDGWKIDVSSPINRRITANTPIELTGAAAGHDLLKTPDDPTGKKVLGTFNNCANGMTPWGTFLTCEENFNGYFASTHSDTVISADLRRYGIQNADRGWQWSRFDARFNLEKTPNEAYRHGWVVEIDPHNPDSQIKKRTALGRFKHENTAIVKQQDGQVIVYMGDDEAGEFLYKFVCKNTFNEDNPLANKNLLDEGILYTAQFLPNEDKGRWIGLVHGQHGLISENGFRDQGEILIKARLAATQVGATPMDRPEWLAIHPDQQQVFCTLTNNVSRGINKNQPAWGPNPRTQNAYGHIIRWQPDDNDHSNEAFTWNMFIMAGNPKVFHKGAHRGSKQITLDNMFHAPDGIAFDKAGRLWIQTDGNTSNQGYVSGMGNNQLLVGDPNTTEVKRFMTGPIGCEITGITFTPDYKTLFIGIQHPGGQGQASNFPNGGKNIARSSVIVITHKQGNIIGEV